MDVIKGSEMIGWWYNPRNGEATKIGKFKNNGIREFISPTPGESIDWVLVLDNADESYGPPGK